MADQDSRSAERQSYGWIAAALATLLFGSLFGWFLHGLSSEDASHSAWAYREARRRSHAGQPVPRHAVKRKSALPTKTAAKHSKVTAENEQDTTKPVVGSRPLKWKSPVGSLPSPLPLAGSLSPVEPAGPETSITKPTTANDIHDLEAKLRVLAMNFGATVKGVHDASGARGVARTIVLSVDDHRARAMIARIRATLGQEALVGEPEGDSDSGEDSDTVGLQAEQTQLKKLQEQLKQAEISFYPDAPALKSLREQYAEQLQKVGQIHSSVKASVQVSVVLTG